MNYWHDSRFINSYDNDNVLDLYKKRNGGSLDLSKNEHLFFDLKENRFFIFRQMSKNDDYKYEIKELNEQTDEPQEVKKEPEKPKMLFREALDFLEKFNNTDLEKFERVKGRDLLEKIKGVRNEAANQVRTTLFKVLKKHNLSPDLAKEFLQTKEFKKDVLLSPKIKDSVKTFKLNLDKLTSNKLGQKLLSSFFDNVASKVLGVTDIMDLFLLLL